MRLVDSNSYIVIDRVHNPSPTAELMIEVALRKNGVSSTSGLTVLVMDSRARLEAANKMLNDLIECKFLIDEERTYKNCGSNVDPGWNAMRGVDVPTFGQKGGTHQKLASGAPH